MKTAIIIPRTASRLTSQTLDTRIDLLVIGASGIDPYVLMVIQTLILLLLVEA